MADVGDLLAAGDYERGWAAVEAAHAGAFPRERAWTGEPTHDSIVVLPQDGLGDRILLARFVREIRTRGTGPVIVAAGPELARLWCRVPGVDDVLPVTPDEYGQARIDIPEAGHRLVNLSTLPRMFHCRPFSVSGEPYITAAPQDIDQWRGKLPQSGLRVGLVWKCGTRVPDHIYRSLPSLETLAPLWDVPGVEFVSLQVGPGAEEVAMCPRPLLDLGAETRDLADTAAIMTQLDLVVSVDTAAANLAGATGVPVWVPVPPQFSYRWMHHWYDSATVFAQSRFGEWAAVVSAMAEGLSRLSSFTGSGISRQLTPCDRL